MKKAKSKTKQVNKIQTKQLKSAASTIEMPYNDGEWWSTWECLTSRLWEAEMEFNKTLVQNFCDTKEWGNSVRCVRDD